MAYQMIFCDLDGTALNENGKLSYENNEAIYKLKDRGIVFVPTTGRALREIPSIVLEHPAIRYFATSNGTAIYDKETDHFIETNGINGEKLSFIRELIHPYTLIRNIHKDGISYFDKPAYDNYQYYRVTDYYHDCLYNCTIQTDHFDELINEAHEIEMFALFFKYDHEMEDCRKRLEEAGGFQITSSCDYALEVTRAGVSKGIALRSFATRMGVPIENVIAMGDSKNDIAMLDAAGLSLAVSNAVDALKEHANRIICHHNEHAIQFVLTHIL